MTVRDDLPYGIDLETYARVDARIAEGDRPAAELLGALGLPAEAWRAVAAFWNERMVEDVRTNGTNATLAASYAGAFGSEQDSLAPLVALDLSGWAALTARLDHVGVSPRTLAPAGLRMADYFRLVRHWARALARDASLEEAFASFLDRAAGR